ncbi:MAG: tetratricopeptide repeat protein, partial [Verrucomicrobiales bacterium]
MNGDRIGLAWRLFGMVPKTDEVLLAGKIAEQAGLSSAEKQIVEMYTKRQESGEPLEISTYFELAKLYESVGDTRAQFAIYDYMGSHFLKTTYRASILYFATKTASDISEMADAQRHGLNFLAEFPDHEYAPNVTAMLLSSMFFNGEYERCIEIAGDLRPKLALGSKERDLPDFVYSGSLYYLGRYKEAQPELDSHVKNYEDSAYKENTTYYQASNLIKLYEWQRASTLLDAWLKIYEPVKSGLLDVAYLDRATCYFALSTPQNGGNGKSLEYATKIIEGFPQSPVLDRAHSLRGDVQQNDGSFPGAEKSYLTAIEIAEEEDHFTTAASALMQLIPVSAAQEKHKEAIDYYDSFFKKFPDSYYAPNASVGVLASMKEVASARV